jgi:non-canonical poly(A) RNA polymerase PAPD5/7
MFSLHNEILGFHSWVKPREFEDIIRRDLVTRLQSAFAIRYYGAELHAFGSFASGMYLPIADMDLVLLSSTFIRTGQKIYGQKKSFIYAFAAYLKTLAITVPGSIETIANARVPILKFVDKLSGLRVDLSFDNNGGLSAIHTMQSWKAAYPSMPIVVAVIKQFLLLRGLNEVPSGGLGGFSIICLVTSLLQHMPQGYVSPNLGSILMDFFDFYGRHFDYRSVGIRMDPPEYFNKVSGSPSQNGQWRQISFFVFSAFLHLTQSSESMPVRIINPGLQSKTQITAKMTYPVEPGILTWSSGALPTHMQSSKRA